ncbi:hypothetical protein MJI37_24400 [Salmonella enterica subsp. enterica serovar Cerro]|nr:hypothetical protein [Salmonella enterica subsp. enterica serovar Cerro]
MRQHAALGRNIEFIDNAVNGVEHAGQVLHVIGHRVNADHRIACAERKPFVDLRGDTLYIVTGIVRLQTAAKGARNTDGGIGFFDHRHFLTAVDQVGVGADFRHCRHHFGGQPFAGKRDIVHGGFIAQHVFAQFADAPVFNPVIGRFVDVILNQARHAVLFIGNHRIVADIRHRHFRQYLFCRYALLRTCRGNPGQHIPRTQFVGFSQYLFYILKLINIAEQCGL